MAQKLQIFKCELCGHVVEVLHAGGGELVCCGQPMVHYAENATDAAVEKHVPVSEAADHGLKVKVGSVAHPMEEDHYIEWVEVVADGKAYREFLSPGGAPEAVFCGEAPSVTLRAYCNKHGLWRG